MIELDSVTKFSGLFDTRNAVTTDYDDYGNPASVTKHPNNDALYGPYDSVESAFVALSENNEYGLDSLVQGKTVGVRSGDKIVEYWFEKENPSSVSDLVLKSTQGSQQLTSTNFGGIYSTLTTAANSSDNDAKWVLIGDNLASLKAATRQSNGSYSYVSDTTYDFTNYNITTGDTSHEFAVADQVGKEILVMDNYLKVDSNGNVITKNFNSSNAGGSVRITSGSTSVSGSSIALKTINGTSIVGSGNISVTGSGTTTEQPLKILAFGSSYMQDATIYVPFLLEEMTGRDVVLGCAAKSGASSGGIYDLLNGNNSFDFIAKYESGSGWPSKHSTGTFASSALASEDWDIVLIATNPAPNNTNYTYATYAKGHELLVQWIKNNLGTNTKVISVIYPTYPANAGNINESYNAVQKFPALVRRAKSEKLLAPVDSVCVAGTAVINLLCTEFSTKTTSDLWGDSVHLADGCIKLAENYVVAASICDAYGLKWAIYGSSLTPTTSWTTSNCYIHRGGQEGIEENEKLLAQKAAITAIANPYEITPIANGSGGSMTTGDTKDPQRSIPYFVKFENAPVGYGYTTTTPYVNKYCTTWNDDIAQNIVMSDRQLATAGSSTNPVRYTVSSYITPVAVTGYSTSIRVEENNIIITYTQN